MRVPPAIRLSLFAAALHAHAASADLLTWVSDNRYLLVDDCPAFEPCTADSRHPPAPFAPFDDEASESTMSASQQSSLALAAEQATLGGTLLAESPTQPPLGNTTGDARFDVVFEANVEASFTWTGSGALSGGGTGQAYLYDLTADAVLYERSLPAPIDAAGPLEPGHRYQLLLSAVTFGQGDARWSFEFGALPEPARRSGLAAGLMALLGLARLRRGAGALAI